jgi:hypothetical protein
MAQRPVKKIEPSQVERMISIYGSVFDDLANRYEKITMEALAAMITFASQCNRYKNAFLTLSANSNGKKVTLLKVVVDQLLNESCQSNSKRMHMLFVLLRSLSASPEIVKEITRLKVIEDIIGKL